MENDNQNVKPTEETQQEQQVTKPEPNITVTNNGSTMTATVNPVDPMADPETPEDTQQEQQEAPSQEDNLQQTIDTQKQTDVDVKETLTSKGVDFDKLADEYSNVGKLSEDSMKVLKDAGFPESVVNAYLAGLEATNERFVNTVKGYAGGDEGYQKLTEFIKTQPKGVVEAFNASIATGNLGQIQLTIDGLMAKMAKTYGTSNPTIMGGVANAQAQGYTSMEQMTKDMSDPRYQVDPAFTRSVMMKVKNATIF